MEFRPVVRSVCRSAAAARPSLLAGTRPPPSAILLQHHHFTTSSQNPSEAAAAAAQQPQFQSPPPQPAQYRVDKLRASLPSVKPNYPPRPPPMRSDYMVGPKGSKTSPSPLVAKTRPAANNLTNPEDLYRHIQGDMEASTSDLAQWKPGDFEGKYYTSGKPETELRLRPSTGRTVHVRGQVDVARAFRLLERSVAQNQIKREVRQAKAHERPALKRKRQKRERWQARFKVGFRATINRVMELKAQGW